MYELYLYDRNAILELLRTTSPRQLKLAPTAQSALLNETLAGWEWRALGALPLRDALCVDPQRGTLFYGQLCAALAVERLTLSAAEAAKLLGMSEAEAEAALEKLLELAPVEVLAPASWPALEAHGRDGDDALAEFVRRTAREQLMLGVERTGQPAPLALPPELLSLLPPGPHPMPSPPFEAPSGTRRALATALVAVGAAWMIGQLVLHDSIPVQPAGVPLALFTLALLVGVRAGWAGYFGSACIWLVANLPSFHYRTVFSWSTLSLFAVGLLLVACDRRIRAMWAWIVLRVAKK